jgi:hypothetical protein
VNSNNAIFCSQNSRLILTLIRNSPIPEILQSGSFL